MKIKIKFLLCAVACMAGVFPTVGQVLVENLSEGIYKLSVGKDSYTPFDLLADSSALSRNRGIASKPLPFDLSAIEISRSERGMQELSVDRRGKGCVKKENCRWNRYRIENWTFIK